MESLKPRFLVILSFAIVLTSAAASFSGGSGTSSDPYEISNCVELQEIENGSTGTLSDHYELINDIDCSDTRNWNYNSTSGNYMGFKPIGKSFSDSFGGGLDGNNYSVSELYINRGFRSSVGLIGHTHTTSVKNISVLSVNITGGYGTGSLIGVNYNTNVSSSYSTGVVNGTRTVGGLMGDNYGGSNISNSYSNVNVSGNKEVGGLMGYSGESTVYNSYSTGDVFNSGGDYTGGLIGDIWKSNVSSSYSTGDVNGSSYVGGLVGKIHSGSVSSSFSSGNVSGSSYVGGLIGSNSGTVSESYWDVNSSNQSSSAGGTGLTTSEMQGSAAETNMTGLDFTVNWTTVLSSDSDTTSDGYPILQAFDREAQLKAQGIYISGPTNNAPATSNAKPNNTNKKPDSGVELSIKAEDPENDQMNITFYDNSDNSQIGKVENVQNGTYTTIWTGLSSDSTYKWYVEVTDGESTVTSNILSFTTIDVSLTWTDNSDNENGFKIYNNASGSYQKVGSVGADTTSYTDTSSDLSFGTYTCYRVKAYNEFGESSPATGCDTP